MMRSTGSATVSFGLVSVPVKLYSALGAGSDDVSFNLLHRDCAKRVKQQYVCPTCDGVTVERSDMVRGIEVSRDEYLVFTEEEVKAVAEASTGRIDIAEFVPVATVPRAYMERVSFLSPDKGGDRAYALLAAALDKTDRAAVGQYVTRGKETLVLLRVEEGALVLETLRYADAVRTVAQLALPALPKTTPAEAAMAEQLIAHLATDAFDASKYSDRRAARVREAIGRKMQAGGGLVVTEPKAPTVVPDLMAALTASLAAATAQSNAPRQRRVKVA